MQQSNLTKLLICRAGLYTAMTLLYDISTSDFEGCLAISLFNGSCKCLGWISMTTEPAHVAQWYPAGPSNCHVIKIQFSYMKGLLQFKTSACYPILQYSFNRSAFSTSWAASLQNKYMSMFCVLFKKKNYSWLVSQYSPF